MRTRENKIRFDSIDPLTLWNKMELSELETPPESDDTLDVIIILRSEAFAEDLIEEFESFCRDFEQGKADSNNQNGEERKSIAPCKGSLFLWALLKEQSVRSKKLSSVNHIFKDDLFHRIQEKAKETCSCLDFSEGDFDDICEFLRRCGLVRTSKDGIRTTREFARLFHSSFNAWLEF